MWMLAARRESQIKVLPGRELDALKQCINPAEIEGETPFDPRVVRTCPPVLKNSTIVNRIDRCCRTIKQQT